MKPRRLPLFVLLGFGAAAFAAEAPPPTLAAKSYTVTDFIAPLFDLQAGNVKIGELRGATATYRSEQIADLTDFTYQALGPDRSVLYTVESNVAMVYLKQRVALGEGTIHVTAPGFELTGRDWNCDVNSRHLTIQQGVRVEFSAQIGSILK